MEEMLQQGTAIPHKRNDAKEELLPPGPEMEDATKAPEHPTAKEERPQQGPTLLDERHNAKEELMPQGNETEGGTSNPQPHLRTARTPAPNNWQGRRPPVSPNKFPFRPEREELKAGDMTKEEAPEWASSHRA